MPWTRRRPWPASTSAHPEARYFNVGKIGRDQVEDYARRKRMTVEAIERWLAPNLDYESGDGATQLPP